MSEYIQTYLALGRQLDFLSLVGCSIAALFVLAIAREYYLHFASPPAYRVLPWYPIPEDLPTASVAPYGAPAIRRSYQPNMRAGVNGSLGLHLAIIVAALLAAQMAREPPAPPPDPTPDRWKQSPTRIEPPPPLDPTRAQNPVVKYVEGPAPPQTSRIVIPVKDYLASPSATIMSIDEEYLAPFDPDAATSLWGKGQGFPGDDTGVGSGYAPPGEDAPVALDIVEQLPELVTIPMPEYPEVARAQRIEGLVVLKVLVGSNGRVRETRIAKSIPVLDDAAREAAHEAVFRPALWQNKPVAVWVSMPVRFSLREE